MKSLVALTEPAGRRRHNEWHKNHQIAHEIDLRHSIAIMEKPQGTFKLRVKLGAREFEAEGPADLVAERFKEFRAIAEIHATTSSAVPAVTAPTPPHPWLQRLYRHHPHSHTISLRILPQGTDRQADAALLVLLGYRSLEGEEEVPVTRVTEALRQSGVPVTRLDRLLTLHTKQHMVLKAGQGKGGRYRLTTQGLARAEALAQELAALVE